METKTMDHIRERLTEKRAYLDNWHETTPASKKQVQLGMVDESIVQEHLQVIDASLQRIDEGTFGVCLVCNEAVDNELLQMDYTSAVCLGHFTQEELRQLESELELSQIVQRALLPQKIPTISGMEIAAFSRPAQIVSGDYFDFLHFGDGTHGFVIADVSGHGVSSGMLMTSLQTAFHTLVPENTSPVKILERINRLYIHNINFSTFVTIFFARLDPQTRTLSYASAGHNPPFIYHSLSKEETWLMPTGPAIGLMEEYRIRPEKIQLISGDVLLLYTDGATEAMNEQGEQFGYERLAEVIRQNENLSADGITQKIRQSLTEFSQGAVLADDITLVVCKVS